MKKDVKKNVSFAEPKQKGLGISRVSFIYLTRLVLRAPAPLSFGLLTERTTHAQLLAFAEAYSKWYDGVMPVRRAYESYKAHKAAEEAEDGSG